jgi:hypothetical protein
VLESVRGTLELLSASQVLAPESAEAGDGVDGSGGQVPGATLTTADIRQRLKAFL